MDHVILVYVQGLNLDLKFQYFLLSQGKIHLRSDFVLLLLRHIQTVRLNIFEVLHCHLGQTIDGLVTYIDYYGVIYIGIQLLHYQIIFS